MQQCAQLLDNFCAQRSHDNCIDSLGNLTCTSVATVRTFLLTVADPRGTRDVRTPLGPNSCMFMQFWAKSLPNNRLAHHWGLALPLGKSWICHWLTLNNDNFWKRGGARIFYTNLSMQIKHSVMRGEGVWDIPSLLQSMAIDNILMFLRRKTIVTRGKLHDFNFFWTV